MWTLFTWLRSIVRPTPGDLFNYYYWIEQPNQEIEPAEYWRYRPIRRLHYYVGYTAVIDNPVVGLKSVYVPAVGLTVALASAKYEAARRGGKVITVGSADCYHN